MTRHWSLRRDRALSFLFKLLDEVCVDGLLKGLGRERPDHLVEHTSEVVWVLPVLDADLPLFPLVLVADLGQLILALDFGDLVPVGVG